jgi:hypothetical protein
MANSILANLLIKISANSADLTKGLKQSQNQVQSFIGSVQKMAGQIGLAFGAFQAFDIVKGAVSSIMEFEKELSTVRAITGATDKEFQQLKRSALDLGASTKYTSTQVAQLQVEYGRLGFTTAEILAATKATLDLATATGSDLAQAADVAGSTVRGFQLSASETQRVVDVMAESFNKTALGLDNFRESMKYVAPIASAANVSVEETTALLGVLADAGIRGSQAGTSLRKIFGDLSKDGRPLAERLEELGRKGLTLSDAYDEVGRTAQTALLVLSKNTSKTRELTGELNYAAGAGKEAARVMSDNLAGDIVKLESAYDGFIQSLGEGTSILRDITQALTKMFGVISQKNGAFGSFVSGWLKLAFIVPRTTAAAIGGVADLLSGAAESNRILREQDAKTQLIANHVKAAFANGTKYVYDYIAALEGVDHRQEITLAIYRKLREELLKQHETQKASTEEQKGIIQQLEDRIKSLGEALKGAFSEQEIVRYNVQLEETKKKLEALLAARPLSRFGREQLANAQSGDVTQVTSAPDKNTTGSTFLAEIGLGATDQADQAATAMDTLLGKLGEYQAKLLQTKEIQKAQTDAELELRDQRIQAYQDSIDSAVSYGSVIGQTIGSIIQDGESGIKAIKRLTGAVLQEFLKQALGGAVKSAMATPGPPPLALGALALLTGVVTAAFSKLGASGGGSSIGRSVSTARSASDRSSSLSRTSGQDSNPTLQTVIRGQDLYVILSNYERNNKQLRFG